MPNQKKNTTRVTGSGQSETASADTVGANTIARLQQRFTTGEAGWNDLVFLYLGLLKTGQEGEAATRVLELAPQLDLKHEGFDRFVRSLFRTKAFALMQQLATVLPLDTLTNESALTLFARALNQQGDYLKSLHFVTRLLESNPASAELNLLKDGLLNRLEDRIVTAAPGAEGVGSGPEAIVIPQHEMTRLIEAGQFEAALDIIDGMIASGTATLSLLMLGAKCAMSMNDEDKAKSYLAKAIELFPANVQPKLQMAEFLEGQGHLTEALQWYEAALQVMPHSTRLQRLRRNLAERLSEGPESPRGHVELLPFPASRVNRNSWWGRTTDHFATFWRVIWNLALRQIRLKHPRSALGLVLIVVEPVAYVAVLWLAMEYLIHRARPPIGEHWVFFYATGIIPYLLFTHLASSGARGRMPYRALLEVPIIKPVSILIAMSLAELLVMASAATLLFGAFYLFGIFGSVNDAYGILAAFLATWLLGTGFMMFNYGITSFIPSWQTAWMLLQRVLFFVSGIFLVAQAVPKPFRDYMVWNPLLICIEWFRHGFYTLYNPPWIDLFYLSLFIGLSLLLGIALQAVANRRRAT